MRNLILSVRACNCTKFGLIIEHGRKSHQGPTAPRTLSSPVKGWLVGSCMVRGSFLVSKRWFPGDRMEAVNPLCKWQAISDDCALQAFSCCECVDQYLTLLLVDLPPPHAMYAVWPRTDHFAHLCVYDAHVCRSWRMISKTVPRTSQETVRGRLQVCLGR